MKKSLFLLLALLTVSFSVSAYDFMVGGLCYNKNSDGTTVTLTYQNNSGPRYSNLSGNLTIPSTVTYSGTSYAVTMIGDNAFRQCSGLTSVTIPGSVTLIGNNAFYYCSGLTSVTIPNSVTSIGEYAFSFCFNLTSIVVNSGNVKYDSRNNCNAIIDTESNTLIVGCKNTIIPNTVTSIGAQAFFGCTSLTSVAIPYHVTSICSDAFAYCSGLTSVTIPNSVTSIDYGAFSHCSSLTSVRIPNSIISIVGNPFMYCSALASIEVSIVEYNAKYDSRNNCNAIIETESNTLITGCMNTIIPNTVTSIGNNAFRGCTGLTSVTIPNSVTSVGLNAFNQCSNVKTINYRTGYLFDNVGYNGFYGMENVEVVNFDEDAKIVPPNFLKIFSNLQEVNIGSSVTTIYTGAFDECGNLTKLGYNATNLQTEEISIGSLKRLTIGENVISIPSDKAFYNCTSLQMILFNGDNPPTIPSCQVFPEGSFLTIKNKNAVGNYKYYYNPLYISAGYSGAPILPWSIWNLKLQSLGGYSASAIAYADDIGNVIFSEAGFLLDGNIRIKTSVMNKDTEKGYMTYSVNNIPNLIPGKTYKVQPYIIVDGIEYIDIYGGNLMVQNVINSYDYSIAPSSLVLTDKTTFPSDLSYKGSKLTLNGNSYESYGNNIVVTGLKPTNYYSGTYSVMLSDGSCSIVDCSFYTPSLTLNNQAVKMLTNSTAMFQAFTNLSEEETSCGFNWKRYDAPDEMLGNPVYCPVYDGMMMGTLKNLPEGVYYKYRPFYRASDGTLYYGEWVAFYTGDANVQFDPVAHTYDNARVSGSQSIIQGIAIRGSQEITEQGFEYWIDNTKNSMVIDGEENVTIKASSISKVTATGERMSATLNSLKGNTTYAFRAYVKTASGTTYGELRTFRTPVVQASGDVNGDGVVTSYDVTALYNYLLNNEMTHYSTCDINGDGQVTAADVTAIYDILLGN